MEDEQGRWLTNMQLNAPAWKPGDRIPGGGDTREAVRVRHDDEPVTLVVKGDGPRQVLQPVHDEVASRPAAGEIAGCLRKENPTAVTGRSDARSAIHVDPHDPFVGHRRLARVQSNAHADRSIGERFTNCCGSRQRVRSPRERDEECASLRVYLDAAMERELLAQRPSVIGQHVRVLVAEQMHKPR
jgi:hypothetical protein